MAKYTVKAPNKRPYHRDGTLSKAEVMHSMTKEDILIRRAERQDVPLLLDFIRGIARYEKMENEVIASPEVLEREMFDEHRAEAVFAVVDGREVGFALYFYNFSTFIGHSGLYLEDLFVWPEERGKGYGKALLLHLVRIAREHHCGRMEWTCLNWNQPSIDFYLSLGAVPMNEWTIYRLDAAALERLNKFIDIPYLNVIVGLIALRLVSKLQLLAESAPCLGFQYAFGGLFYLFLAEELVQLYAVVLHDGIHGSPFACEYSSTFSMAGTMPCVSFVNNKNLFHDALRL